MWGRLSAGRRFRWLGLRGAASAYWPICVVSPLAFGSLLFVAEAVGLRLAFGSLGGGRVPAVLRRPGTGLDP